MKKETHTSQYWYSEQTEFTPMESCNNNTKEFDEEKDDFVYFETL